jgi:hypothetical protein
MLGKSDSSATYWTKTAAVSVNWVKLSITIINLIFGAFYFFFSIWLSTIFLLFAIFLPSFFLLFWLGYREKSGEFRDMSKKEIADNSGITRDIIALFGNVLLLCYLLTIMFTTIFEGFNLILLYSPIFIVILTDFEILGLSMAYIQVIGNWNDKPE